MVVTTEPRWANHVDVNDQASGGPWEFCEQVGDLDVWICPMCAMYIKKNGISQTITYPHAVLKFPRIAEKMIAMRAFLWGE